MKLTVVIVVLLIIVALPIIIVIAAIIRSAKYEYIHEKDKHGNWIEVPVFHPCGEPIDKEFIELWHQREQEYKEDMKRSKRR